MTATFSAFRRGPVSDSELTHWRSELTNRETEGQQVDALARPEAREPSGERGIGSGERREGGLELFDSLVLHRVGGDEYEVGRCGMAQLPLVARDQRVKYVT